MKVWQDTLSVTPESFTTSVKVLCHSQHEKLPALRRRLTKAQLEEHANLASLVRWLGSACLADEPAVTKQLKRGTPLSSKASWSKSCFLGGACLVQQAHPPGAAPTWPAAGAGRPAAASLLPRVAN